MKIQRDDHQRYINVPVVCACVHVCRLPDSTESVAMRSEGKSIWIARIGWHCATICLFCVLRTNQRAVLTANRHTVITVLVSRYFHLMIYYIFQFSAAHNPIDPMNHCWAIKIKSMLIFFHVHSFSFFFFVALNFINATAIISNIHKSNFTGNIKLKPCLSYMCKKKTTHKNTDNVLNWRMQTAERPNQHKTQ